MIMDVSSRSNTNDKSLGQRCATSLTVTQFDCEPLSSDQLVKPSVSCLPALPYHPLRTRKNFSHVSKAIVKLIKDRYDFNVFFGRVLFMKPDTLNWGLEVDRKRSKIMLGLIKHELKRR